MKKIFLLLFMVSLTTLIACGGGQVQSGNPNEAWVSAANAELAQHSLGIFAYKKSDLPGEWNSWLKTSSPVLQRVISEIPEGYVLQVTGHACERGPELEQDAKPGNLQLSADRAKKVYDGLVKNNINPAKLTSKGVSTSQPIDKVDPKDAKQRRVSFRIVQK